MSLTRQPRLSYISWHVVQAPNQRCNYVHAMVGKNSSITRINEKLLAFDDWSAASIVKHQTMLLALASDIWKVREMDAHVQKSFENN